MREEYDFSKGKKNPYAKQLKKQVTIKLNAKKKLGDDEINDEINDEIKEDISDLGLAILRAVAKKPGIKAKDILEELSSTIEGITIDKVRNEIQRNLKNHIELVGSRKSGGYHIKR
jgi:multidrug efflux pump subunit AcrB